MACVVVWAIGPTLSMPSPKAGFSVNSTVNVVFQNGFYCGLVMLCCSAVAFNLCVIMDMIHDPFLWY